MASKIDIVNLALSRLSSARITSFNDNTIEAKTINTIYDQVAENVMAMGPWTACTRRATLARTTETPVFGYNYSYQLPTSPKCLRLIRINECKLGDTKFDVEGTKLLTDLSSVQIKYITFLTDSEDYGPYLRQAITERIIVELGYAKTGEYKINQGLEQAFQAKVEMWLNEDNQQASSEYVPSDTFTDIRNEN